jgi:hypothetical protein
MANIEKFSTPESEIKNDFENRIQDYEEIKRETLDEVKTELANIRGNVTKIEQFCSKEGLPFKKPLLILGTFERVGSNWLLDTLNQHVHTHNEPFKQQLSEESEFSTMSPQLESIEKPLTSDKDPFPSYWLETFVAAKYGTIDHAVKENNLFFALENYLKFFPDTPILIVKREPLGILSSFIDQDLFDKWDYEKRYEQLKNVSHSEKWESFQFICDDTDKEEKPPIVRLTRMLFLNSLLMAHLLGKRPCKELTYESSIKDRSEVLQFLSTEVFPGKTFSDTQNNVPEKQPASQGIFSTRRTKNKLESYLDADDQRIIFEELNRLFDLAREKFDPTVIERTQHFLSYGKNQYSLAGRRNLHTSPESPEKTAEQAPMEFISDDAQKIEWRNILATNEEYCSFLNEMRNNGINNIVGGGQMLFNENMIDGRGGRIHFNKDKNKYEVSPGYENHPVYWVTWIGSSAFALSKGLRLPKRTEINTLVYNTNVSLDSINAGHKLDDVQPVNIEDYVPGEVNNVVGNLAVWCSDGKNQLPNDPQSATRYIYGTAWNRPATLREITKEHARPLVGNSRGVGIRLVKDGSSTQISPSELIERLRKIQTILKDNGAFSLHEKDEKIINLFNT